MQGLSKGRGFTLLEVIIVLGIIAVALGLGIGLLRSQGLKLEVTTNQLITQLAMAQSIARQTGSVTSVNIDPEDLTVSVWTKQTLDMYHFEQEVKEANSRWSLGAFERKALVEGAFHTPNGRLGYGYEMDGNDWIRSPQIPLYHPAQGIIIELWILPRREFGRQRILDGAGEFSLSLKNRALEAKVSKYELSKQILLPTGCWTHVAIMYFHNEAMLWVNGKLVSRVALDAPVRTSLLLQLGAQEFGFVGTVDELRVSLIIPQQKEELAEIQIEAPEHIFFTPSGWLDTHHHTGPIIISLRHHATTRTITITRRGLIRWD
jgi:prepilin-type N-terminal cleavage/methylation domain-containing protein